MKNIKKLLLVFSLATILIVRTLPVYADDIPQAPTAPTAPTAPVAPTAPTAPTAPSSSSTDTSTSSTNTDPTSQPTTNNSTTSDANATDPTSPTPTPSITQSPTSSSATPTTSPSTSTSTTQPTTSSSSSTTGSSTPTSSSTQSSSPSTSDPQIIGNGSASSSTTNESGSSATTTTQGNSATVGNGLNQATITGKNNASENVGTTNLQTGDANQPGTIISNLNTNLSGVSVSEFNVADNQTGDLVLDFPSHCIINCSGGQTTTIGGNGSSSNNTANNTSQTTNNASQSNDATVGNNLILTADSGDNTASLNTGGDTNITTGKANIDANVATFANNNIAGNVEIGFVNIYGNLSGDIVLPDSAFTNCTGCSQNTTGVSNNGSGSTNTADSSSSNTSTANQTDGATITNNLSYAATTGGNDGSRNTDGNTTVDSGSAQVDSKTLNIANSNINGGNWWLVLVNKAGQWIGQIVGAPDGAQVGGSSGTTFTTDAQGNVTAITGNGAQSNNTVNTNGNTTTTTNQSNLAHITNNITLAANTGNNASNDNTGGNSTITTGDAKIIANLINFVNNNIVGNGKLLVTVVNVFGSWLGDFVGPGQQKQAHAPAPQQNNTQQAQTTSSQSSNNHTTSTAHAASNLSGNTQFVSTIDPTTIPSDTQNTQPADTISMAGFHPSSFSNLAAIPQTIQDTTNVLAAHTVNPNIFMNTHHVLTINLAWLLVILPTLGLLWMVGRRIQRMRNVFSHPEK